MLAAIIVCAAVVGWISQRIGLVPIVGFLVVGALIGPNALGVVDSVDEVELAAEVGVILLLFSIGIEFSLARLARVKRLVIGGGSLTVLFATAITAAAVVLSGAGLKPAVYTGLLVSVSSTAVVLSLLASRHETSSHSGQLSIAVLVFEDLAVVGMVLLVPMLGTDGGSTGELVRALVVSAAVIVGVLVVARRVMPPLLEAVARVCAPEVFLLAVLAVCFATAYVTSLAGVSVSLGAFLAGLVVSESRFSSHALGEILPLQVVFTATFFVSVGMLLDPAFLVEEPLLVVAVVAGVLVIKASTGTLAARLVGVALPVAIASAFARAQIGEFSFVLEQVGRDAGLTPLDLGDDGVQAFLAGSIILMVMTPVLSPFGTRVGHRFGGSGDRSTHAFDLSPGHDGSDGDELTDHVIVAGYGEAARSLVPDLRGAGIPFVVTTLNPQGALYGRSLGVPMLLGDASKSHALERAGVRVARLLVVADDDEEVAERIAGVAAALNPDLEIVVRLDEEVDVERLASSGADVVVTGPAASARELAAVVVRRYYGGAEIDRPGTVDSIDLERVIRFDPRPSACTHSDHLRPVLPSAPGCEECLQMGDTWVHLRICLTCGHVGCCDESPNRHARRHASELHPIARSLEVDEQWAWCYPDDLQLDPVER